MCVYVMCLGISALSSVSSSANAGGKETGLINGFLVFVFLTASLFCKVILHKILF